jgi:Nuclear transport factor 2 (NTF2) domain
VVCLSTVDSVESIDNSIVIQVLGELSNNAAPSQKFAQTFVLAYVPPTGYFVLNDIFRYLKEDTDSEFDDTGPESANEMESVSAHDHISSDRLSNGFHPAAHPIDNDDRSPNPISLPAFSVPTNPMPETSMDPEEDLSTDRLESRPIDANEIQFSSEACQTTPVQAACHDAHIDEPKSSNTDKSGSLETEPDTPNDIPAIPTFDSPVIKTWASMAATNREKWSAQVEQRATVSGTGTHPRTEGHPTVARKEIQKALHQGIQFSPGP